MHPPSLSKEERLYLNRSAPRSAWPTPLVKLLMKRHYTVAARGPEETNTPLWQTVFETGHGRSETGIANNACTHRNSAVEKHKARPLGHDLFETPAPGIKRAPPYLGKEGA
ncbi:hypothetical protein KIL84_019590 [Mauremys mutica]|uniref:Uncharacterized protein n=1 Tax=Mauremys mutica TaxID=74926 RepID=A0A9D4BAF0_9SAUR|nr:hypothetical protein KIL84_019590 [Mauremys mutica]